MESDGSGPAACFRADKQQKINGAAPRRRSHRQAAERREQTRPHPSLPPLRRLLRLPTAQPGRPRGELEADTGKTSGEKSMRLNSMGSEQQKPGITPLVSVAAGKNRAAKGKANTKKHLGTSLAAIWARMGIGFPAGTPTQLCSGFAYQFTRPPINASWLFLLICTSYSLPFKQQARIPPKQSQVSTVNP